MALLNASCTCAVTAGEIVAPAAVVVGGCMRTTFAGTPGATTMSPVVAAVSAPSVNVSRIVSATLYERLENVATPDTTPAVVVPCRTPVPNPVARAAVTVPDAVVTTFPAASSTSITGCVLNMIPAVSGVDGAVWITRWVAAPAVFVRLNRAGVPAPATSAVSVYVPAVPFAVNTSEVAIPVAAVVLTSVLTAPANVPVAPEGGAAKVTDAPLTGLLNASCTIAESGSANAAPTPADCPDPALTAMLAGPAARTVKLPDAFGVLIVP